ncbi:Talin-2 [Bienertia sinuspersici]
MNGLDSSFEALAFIPVNLSPLFSAAVNNLWALLAFLTAAFSFWRLRSSSPKTTSSHFPPPPIRTTTNTTSFKVIEDEEEEEKEEVVLTRANSKKFFTVFYEERENDLHDDDEMDGGDLDLDLDLDHDHDDVDEGVCEDECMVIKRWGSTGSTVEMIRSSSSLSLSSSLSSSSSSDYDFGWYNYQDRKVIDGSVVRLWEEERESRSASPRGCRRRCFVGVTKHLALA